MNSAVSNKEKVNPGARGDGLHLSDQAKITSLDTKNLSLDFPSSDDNLASGEPNETPICYSTSSSTFIVSSSFSSDVPIESKGLSTDPRNLLVSNEDSLDQHHWLKDHWISLSILTGILFVIIMIITTIIFLH